MKQPFFNASPLLDLFVMGLERDRLFRKGFTALLCFAGVFSLLAGIAAWPAVVELSATGTVLSAAASRVCMSGWIAAALCAIASLILAFSKKQAFSVPRFFLLNIVLLWVILFVVLLAQQGAVVLAIGASFTTSLLWCMTSLFFGYVLSVVPAIIITVLVTVACKILDIFFPM